MAILGFPSQESNLIN